jgi:putative membrane protein
MGLASLGALVAMVITALINMYIQKDFREEWKLSLSVKSNVPLGEDEVNRLLNEENSRIERD